jgi:WD40 repeat protein
MEREQVKKPKIMNEIQPALGWRSERITFPTQICALTPCDLGGYVYIGGREGSITLLDINDGSCYKLPGLNEEIGALVYDKKSGRLLAGTASPKKPLIVLIRQATRDKLVTETINLSLPLHPNGVGRILSCPELDYFVSAGLNHNIYVWKLSEIQSQPLFTLEQDSPPVDLALVPGTNEMIVATRDGVFSKLALYNLENRQKQAEEILRNSQSGYVDSLAISPKGVIIATGHSQGTMMGK